MNVMNECIEIEDLPIHVYEDLASRARARGALVEDIAREVLITATDSTTVELRDTARARAHESKRWIINSAMSLLAAAIEGLDTEEAIQATASHVAASVAIQYLADTGQLPSAQEYVSAFHEVVRTNIHKNEWPVALDDEESIAGVAQLLFADGQLTPKMD